MAAGLAFGIFDALRQSRFLDGIFYVAVWTGDFHVRIGSKVMVQGFRVQGSGVQGSGFKGSGVQVQGSKVPGSKFKGSGVLEFGLQEFTVRG